MDSFVLSGVKVVHIVTRLDRGGAAEVILDLIKTLSQHGMRVTLIVGKTDNPQTNIPELCKKNNIELYSIPDLIRSVSPFHDILAYFRIKNIIRKLQPAIVHTHTSKAGIIGRCAAWSAGIQHSVHSPRGHIFYGYYNRYVTFVFVALERLGARITEKITTLTKKGMQDHIDMGVGTFEKFVVIHSGVQIDTFKIGNGHAVKKGTGFTANSIVGWAGRLDSVKNCLLFVESASIIKKRMPESRFLIAGDGEEREMLQERSHDLGLSDCMIFLGDRDDMPDVMAAFDVFVLSSHNEGFGRVLVEAMAAGAVPVSTKVGGTSDVIEDGVSGFLVPKGDSQAMADAVCSLLGDNELYNRLRTNGIKRAELFTLRSMVEKFEELYAELLDT